MGDVGLRVILGAFFLLCLVCLVAGVVLSVRTVGFTRRAQRSTAEIAELVTESVDSTRGVHSRTRARARFRTASGESVEVSFPASELPDPGAAVGGRFGILYDPTQPAGAMVDSFVAVWLAPLLLTVLGLVLSGMVAGAFLVFVPPGAERRSAAALAPLAGSVEDETLQVLRERGKIEAIKHLRDRTGLHLREAKEAVEALERKAGQGR